jgi:ribosomal protein L34
VRLNAVATAQKICIEDPSEKLVSGWTLRTPTTSGLRGSLEEAVLLLTERALYFCRMDWTTEKVKSFDKVELAQIEGLTRGIYITSTFAQRDLDEKKNFGFLVRYNTKAGQELTRVNTRSLSIAAEDVNQLKSQGVKEKASKKPQQKANQDQHKLLAFKALPPNSSYLFTSQKGEAEYAPSEEEQTRSITDEIARLVNAKRTAPGQPDDDLVIVEESDIVSLADAKRTTGYLESLGYSLKKFVWAS